MSDRSVIHSTFVVDRVFAATQGRVFAAFADPKAKALWFTGPREWRTPVQTFDFRVGGHETNVGGPIEGPRSSFDALYLDIVPGERIIYTYEMHLDERKISESLATIELTPVDGGTRLVLTEQGAYLDGFDKPEWRERGTIDLMDALGASLAG